MKILQSELHTTNLPADTLLVEWGNQNGEPFFVPVTGWDKVPAGHKDLTDTLAGWRKRIPNSEPVEMFDPGDDGELVAIVERLGL